MVSRPAGGCTFPYRRLTLHESANKATPSLPLALLISCCVGLVEAVAASIQVPTPKLPAPLSPFLRKSWICSIAGGTYTGKGEPAADMRDMLIDRRGALDTAPTPSLLRCSWTMRANHLGVEAVLSDSW